MVYEKSRLHLAIQCIKSCDAVFLRPFPVYGNVFALGIFSEVPWRKIAMDKCSPNSSTLVFLRMEQVRAYGLKQGIVFPGFLFLGFPCS